MPYGMVLFKSVTQSAETSLRRSRTPFESTFPTMLGTFHPTAVPTPMQYCVCGSHITMQEPYHVGKYMRHLKTCKGPCQRMKPAAEGQQTLTTFITTASYHPALPRLRPPSRASKPCPGLTAVHHAKIAVYLQNTQALGGGVRTESAIAQEMFRKPNLVYRNLSQAKKNMVRTQQHLERRWQNDHLL